MFRKFDKMVTRAYFAAQNKFQEFVRKENGDVNIVSIVVLIGIAVLLAILFRKAITNLLNNMFNKINNSTNEALGPT